MKTFLGIGISIFNARLPWGYIKTGPRFRNDCFRSIIYRIKLNTDHPLGTWINHQSPGDSFSDRDQLNQHGLYMRALTSNHILKTLECDNASKSWLQQPMKYGKPYRWVAISIRWYISYESNSRGSNMFIASNYHSSIDFLPNNRPGASHCSSCCHPYPAQRAICGTGSVGRLAQLLMKYGMYEGRVRTINSSFLVRYGEDFLGLILPQGECSKTPLVVTQH